MAQVGSVEIDDHFAYLSRRGNEVYLTFRGSCNGQNVRTDLDYSTSAFALAGFEAESGEETTQYKVVSVVLTRYSSCCCSSCSSG